MKRTLTLLTLLLALLALLVLPAAAADLPRLVDNADLLLAAYDGQPGGTAMTCELARRYDVPVMKIKPTLN